MFRCFDLIIAPNITTVLWLELFLAKLRTLPGYAYSSPNQSLSLWTTLDLAGYNKLHHSIHPTPHVEIRMISIQCGQGWKTWHYHLLSQTSWNFFHFSPCIHPYKSKKYTREGKIKKREVLLIRVGFKDGESCKLDRMLFGHSPPLKTRAHVPPPWMPSRHEPTCTAVDIKPMSMCKKWLRVLPFYSTENMVKFPWKKNIYEQQQCTQGALSRAEDPSNVDVT